ncbi:MAG: hydroxymethylglutaryl-CoA lyase [Acidimicrobiia bacterium]|nr:hydroxymethylglutaryl-CoA lyase [Acidimicrobiia bacterium]
MLLPPHVDLVEVGPRDGLQAQSVVLDTAAKVELIRRMVSAGAGRVEAVSFAHPRAVPQMADAEAVMEALEIDRPGASLIGLVMNQRGLDRALATSVDEVNFVVPASDGYSRSNQRMTSDEIMTEIEALVPEATAAARRTTVTISVAFGDPYDGPVAPERVAGLAARSVAAGTDEIALGDTIGVATPPDVAAVIDAVRAAAPDLPIRCHFHDTRRAGLANVYAALLAGVTILDTSVGGIGGSPFAPKAGGNVATEDCVAFLERMGVTTSVSLDATIATGRWLAEVLGYDLPAAHQHLA